MKINKELEAMIEKIERLIDRDIKNNFKSDLKVNNAIDNYSFILLGYIYSLLDCNVIDKSEFDNYVKFISDFVERKKAEHKKINGVFAK